ncbi:MAG: magnesium transporter CorA family protein [Hyphomicrobiaceae bacterium]|nr:magnesium transporter CorA family protein [Hyphomicrobiaceae bacterium]
MLTAYENSTGALIARKSLDELTSKPVWIDLLFPTAEEDAAVEKLVGISIPTRAEMREIESSNRLYQEQGAVFMTALVGHSLESGTPQFSSVTYILAGDQLVTVRYSEPRAFPLYLARVEKGEATFHSSAAVLSGLLEMLVQRKADLIEHIQDEVNRIGAIIFDTKGGQQTRAKRLDVALRSIGKLGISSSRAEESAATLDRLLIFLEQALRTRNDAAEEMRRVKIVHRDIRSLIEQLDHLTERLTFLLQAVLGMISIEQNQIIKLFSVMAVMLMPPTLVASIYGMNFRHMPELEWMLGYPYALVTMALAAVIPYVYFRRRGWL